MSVVSKTTIPKMSIFVLYVLKMGKMKIKLIILFLFNYILWDRVEWDEVRFKIIPNPIWVKKFSNILLQNLS